MSGLAKPVSGFSNHRQWRDFVTALHETMVQPYSVGYAKIITAVRSAEPRSAWNGCKSLWMRIHVAVGVSKEAD